MKIDSNKNAETLIVNVEGRLDTTTAPEFENFLNANLQGVKELAIDCAKLEYVSSAGLRVLLSTQKKMQKIGSMKVKNVCEEVMEVFEITGFADILVIE
jgi:anti-sigma B factor antagonist